MITIEVEGVGEIQRRFQQYPQKFDRVLGKTLDASLLTIWGDVPSYPVYDSPYARTGTLGRTLGVGKTGRKLGEPDILEKNIGPNMFEASFGTRLEYAPFVVGETTQAGHMAHWWTLDGTVFRKVKPKLEKLFKIMVEELARWLDGRR